MTGREAKKLACRLLARLMRSSAEGGCPIDLDLGHEDRNRLEEAWSTLAEEMDRRGRDPETVPATLRPEDRQPRGAATGVVGFYRGRR